MQFVQNAVQVVPGNGRVASLTGASDEEQFAVMFTTKVGPNIRKSDYSQFHIGGQPVVLSNKTTPLVLSLPGTYLFEPDGDILGTPEIDVGEPFPVMTVVSPPAYPVSTAQEGTENGAV